MEFNLFNCGKRWEDWWVEVFVVKVKVWEPALFKLSYSHGKWEWDLFGTGELLHWWKAKK
jgi:hypothetical protein